MSTATKDAPAKADREAAATTQAKEAIYGKIAEFVKTKTTKNIGKTGGQEVFNLVVEEVFAAAARLGEFRFNQGFGSLHVRKYKAGSRRLPSGSTTTFGERSKLRYEEGVVVETLVENGGDLASARRVRTSPAKPAAASADAGSSAPQGDVDLD